MSKRSGNVKRLLAYARPYRRMLVLSTLVGVTKYNLPVIFPWVLKDVIDNLVVGKPSRTHLTLDQLMAFALVLFFTYALICYLRTYLFDRLNYLIISDIREDLFHHLQRLPLDFFQSRQTGAISSRLFTDVNQAQSFIWLVGTNLFMDITSILTISVVVFSLDWKLGLVAYSTLPFYFFLQKYLGERLKQNWKEARRRMDKLEGDFYETASGIAEVKSFTYEKEETKRFVAGWRHFLEAALEATRTHTFSQGATALLTRIPPVIVLWVGGHLVLQGKLTVGSLMAFYAYLEMVYNPLNRLSELNIQLASARAAIDRLFEFFDMEPESENEKGPRLLVQKGRIQFHDVVFGYRPGLAVSRGLNLRIEPGEHVAFVGASGAGKSTAIKLLMRFYDPWHGRVTIDGQDIRDVNTFSLRSQIALVQQDPILFSGTIENNIRVGKPAASLREIRRAAEMANASSFIDALPEGLQTEIGERGVRLSAGQKQRIVIARAFLKNAPILVLDESTSHLDGLSERPIYDALRRLTAGRTTIVIAHRISTVVSADRIIVFHAGKVVQEGTHDRLLTDRHNYYYKVYSSLLCDITGNSMAPLPATGQ